jgi:hypothetical protein
VLSISPGDLVAFALQHLHPASLAKFRYAGADRSDPSTLCWRAGDEGALVHAFDYYPVMLYPRAASAPDPVDHALLGALGFGANEISIIRDSKAFVQCQMSDEAESTPSPPRDAAAVAAWALANTGNFQRMLFRNEIRLLATDTPSKRWDAVAAVASAEVMSILGTLTRTAPASRRA